MSIIKEIKLSLSDVKNNNNKYWSGKIDESHNVIMEWGRIGDSLQSKSKSFRNYNEAQSFLKSKINEKKRKGYSEIFLTSSNSENIIINNDKQYLKNIAKSQIISDDETLKLIERLTEENVHNILSSTNLKFSKDDGLFSTPLGVVDDNSIKKARNILNRMSDYVKNNDFNNEDYIKLLNNYLTLIPQKVGRILKNDIYSNLDDIKCQNDIIDSLEISNQKIINNVVNKSEVDKIFSCEIKSVKDISVINYIDNKFKSTKQSIHKSFPFKLKNVYSVKIDKQSNEFKLKGEPLGEIWELWHGTKISNLLSILMNGLVIVPENNSNVTGRMFSNGLYFSDQSTKALNYSMGYWDGKYTSNCFAFLCDVAMGKYYTPKSCRESLPKPGYDSTYAKGGYSGVINNEMIVPNIYQTNLKYLIEFEK